jgi:hypothetical protein
MITASVLEAYDRELASDVWINDETLGFNPIFVDRMSDAPNQTSYHQTARIAQVRVIRVCVAR